MKDYCIRGHLLKETRVPDGNGSFRCGECRKLRQKINWKNRAPSEYAREYHLQRSYNLSLEEWENLYDKQNGKCAICVQEEKDTNQHGVKRLSVDHDHETGEVRGLLCTNCNTVLGRFKDDIKLFQQAIQYLS